jgi:hypothetical protein
MTTKTLRLSDNLLDAVHELGHAEQVEEATAMRKLLRMGYGLFLAEQYRAGRLTLRAVAQRMDLSLSETLEALQRLGVTGNTGADATLASWFSIAPVSKKSKTK